MHRSPEFLALSRWGQVPVLQHDGWALVQSGAILEYLAETLGAFAGSAATRQAVREWLFWDADRFAPPIYGCYGVKLGQLKLLPIDIDASIAEDHRRRAEEALYVLDANLTGQDFLASSEPTIADICCYGEVAFARMCDFDVGRWRNVERWAARLSNLPGFAAPFDLLGMSDSQVR
jgi:glutathione S-transferase